MRLRRFELPNPVVRSGDPLPEGDPRAVLRDHGLCEELDHEETRRRIMDACKHGDVEVVQAYVALGFDLNSRLGLNRETPLICAAANGQSQVVRALVAAGADLNLHDELGYTALGRAIFEKRPSVLRTLLEVGASPDIPNRKWGRFPLAEALESGKDELISILLASRASPNVGGSSKESALHWCLKRRDADRLRELLARPDADRNLATATGDTLLHLAIYEFDEDAIETLLDAGADPSRTNDSGWNPRDVAVANAAHSLAERLERADAPLTQADAIAYFAAIRMNEPQWVAAALDAGLSIESRDWRGRTGFLYALSEGKHEIAELLRERGADVNALDDEENNALSHAGSNERRKWCLEIGVAASYRDSYGKLRQPGVAAVLEDDDPELLRTLLDARTNWSDLSDLSEWNFQMVYESRRVEERANTLRMLGAAGADVEAVGDDGSSLLLHCCDLEREPYVMALLDVGVDIERENYVFVTPLHASCDEMTEHEAAASITAALLARGADHTKINWLGHTAWDCANWRKNRPCQELLEQVFEQQRIDALAEHGLDPDTRPEELEPAVFATLARRCDLESFRHWVRQREHELVRGLLRAGFRPDPPALDRHGVRPGETALTTAVQAEDTRMVGILLEGGADPNLVLHSDYTALKYASTRDIESIRLLLAAGANPNFVDEMGYTPMDTAANLGDIERMQMLYEAGAVVQPRPAGPSPLSTAVWAGKFEAAQWLLARGAHIDARNKGRITALHTAIERNQIEIALALIAAGADVDVRTSDGWNHTPLILATKLGHIEFRRELVEALLDAGADATVQDGDGQSAADYASLRDELRELFPETEWSSTKVERNLPALLRAVHCDDLEGFTTALADGVDVVNYRGETALMLAAAYKRKHMFESLLEAGADIHATNVKGDNAWMYAYWVGAHELRWALEKRGLERSEEEPDLSVLEKQIDVDWRVRQMIQMGDAAAVAWLIDELDFDVDLLVSPEGWASTPVRPLELAIDSGDAAMVKVLISKGADPSLPDSSGVPLRARAEAAGIRVA